jgi:hypothetical protein
LFGTLLSNRLRQWKVKGGGSKQKDKQVTGQQKSAT